MAALAGSLLAGPNPSCDTRRSNPFNARRFDSAQSGRLALPERKMVWDLKSRSRHSRTLLDTDSRDGVVLHNILPVGFVAKREVKNFVISPPTPF